jgi:probable HAF family extracellular repeat protein
MKSATVKFSMIAFVFATLSCPKFLAAQNQHLQPSYLVFELNTFGGSSSSGNTINNLAWVMGNANLTGDQATNAALWIYGAKFDLGTLGGANSGVFWPVHNTEGLISGIAETATVDPTPEIWSCGYFFPSFTFHTCQGFVWQDGLMTPLPTLGGNNGYGAGMNNLGQVVGWAENTTVDSTCTAPQVYQFEAVLYSRVKGQYQATQLPPYSGDPDGAATAINNQGEAVGISGLCSNAVGGASAEHALSWQNGVATNLGNLGGMAWNTPQGINDSGEIVGFSNTSGNQFAALNPHAFLWTPQSAVMQDLGTLSGDTVSEAVSVNDQGQIVGLSCTDNTFSDCHAFLYQNGAMTDLNNLTSNTKISLYAANDIDSRGDIAGVGIDAATGELRGFIAVPGPFDLNAAAKSKSERSASRVVISESVRRQALAHLGLGGMGATPLHEK